MDYTALHAPAVAAAAAPATAAPKLRLLPATASMLAAKQQQQQQKVPSPVLSSTTAPLLAGHARTASTASASIITPAAAAAAFASAAQSTDDESPAKRAKLSKESSPSSSRTITSSSSSAAAAAPLVPMPAEVSLMLAEFEMNLDSRTHRLREQTKFMLTSLQRSFKNELNKIPAKVISETCSSASDFAGQHVFSCRGNAFLRSPASVLCAHSCNSFVCVFPYVPSTALHRFVL
jgi:hypothetical protein